MDGLIFAGGTLPVLIFHRWIIHSSLADVQISECH